MQKQAQPAVSGVILGAFVFVVILVVLLGILKSPLVGKSDLIEPASDRVLLTKNDGRVYSYLNGKLTSVLPDGYTSLSTNYSWLGAPFFLVEKDNQLSIYDILQSKIEPLTITLTQNPSIKETADLSDIGSDRNEAILTVSTYDKTSSDYTKCDSAFAGSIPIPVKTQEYRYTFSTHNLVKSNIVNDAYAVLDQAGIKIDKGECFSTFTLGNWDNVHNLMYGYSVGEGVGNAAPIYRIDLTKKTVTQSSLDLGSAASVVPYFKPTLDKLILIEDDSNASSDPGKIYLKLYATTQLDKPLKTFDISSWANALGGIGSINWSEDGNTVLVAVSGKTFYRFDLSTGVVKPVYTDNTLNSSLTAFDPNSPAIILPSNKRFIYVDWSNPKTQGTTPGDSKDNLYDLTVVDMNTGKATKLYESKDLIGLLGIEKMR